MIIVENNCVGCPQGCINCGRKHEEAIICDECRDEYAEYQYEGNDYCEWCFEKALENEFEVEKSFGDCESCGDPEEKLYDGMCAWCFKRKYAIH